MEDELNSWDAAGERVSSAVTGLHAILVVTGSDHAGAAVALGIGREQARRRRVAVGDLIGELQPLQALLGDANAHGIAESFVYGISLNGIAHPVAGNANLFVMPGGSEPVATAEILSHRRWQRLAAGFREMGALLILVVRPGTPGLDVLAKVMEGAIQVGDAQLPAGLPLIAPIPVDARSGMPVEVRESGALHEAGSAAPERRPDSDRRGSRAIVPAGGDPARAGSRAPHGAGAPRESGTVRRRVMTVTLAGLAVATVAAALFISRNVEPVPAGPVVALPDSVIVLPDTAPPRDAVVLEPPPPVQNPADSARASGWSVEVVAANTEAGANLRLQEVRSHPAATMAPGEERSGWIWYRVFVGAYPERSGADSLLRALRERGVIGEDVDRVVRLPFALLGGRGVPAAEVEGRLEGMRGEGLPAYALGETGGSSTIYIGAFAVPEQAMYLAPALRRAGLEPVIVYRTGRAY